MKNQTMNPEQTAAMFADPVAYLAGLGIEADDVSETTLVAAA